jgi:AraC-like DNA-binding protein
MVRRALHVKRAVLPAEKTCPVGALSELPNLMRELGHDPWALLETFGVTPELMAKPLTPVPVSLHGRILEAAEKATGRETLGLLLGERATLENAGPLRLLVFNARTMREAVESLVRFVGLWYRGLRLELSYDEGVARLSLSADGRFPGRDHLLTSYLAALVKHLGAIFGRSWRPSQVQIPYRRPRSAELHARVLRGPVVYDRPRHALLFPEASLDQRRAGSDQKLDAFLRQYLSELEAREQLDFVARVRHVIENLLASDDCTIERVAGIFAVHRVTLHRHLREHGVTFEALLDESRRELAAQMLEHTDLPVGEIAETLGYGAAGSFVRAFSRWHGVPPGAWRRRKRRTAAPARVSRRRSS